MRKVGDREELPYSMVLAIAAEMKRPGADATRTAERFGVCRQTVMLIAAGDHVRQRRTRRCKCGGMLLNGDKDCLACTIRQTTNRTAA